MNPLIQIFQYLLILDIFLIDKFIVGLNRGYTYLKYNYEDVNVINNSNNVAGGGYSFSNWLDIGPFARYYFLPGDQRVNLLAELNYSYGWSNKHSGKGNRDNYSFSGGPVVFFNSTAAIEFLIGYNSSKTKTYFISSNEDDYSTKKYSFQLALSFQIYLQNN